MLKNLVRLEAVIQGKVGHFLLDHDTTSQVAKEMCFQFLKYLGQLEDQAKEQQAKQQPPGDSAPSETPKEEPPKGN